MPIALPGRIFGRVFLAVPHGHYCISGFPAKATPWQPAQCSKTVQARSQWTSASPAHLLLRQDGAWFSIMSFRGTCLAFRMLQ
jgi:hypothetical protein